MKFNLLSSSLAVIASAATVHATNHQVNVGLTGLTYSPDSVTAAMGDTIEFIVSGTHSIVEAAFGSPCSYLSGGAWSGIAPTPNFVITVTDTTPRFFYCSVDSHCQSGMVFALNPSSSETESAFASAAASAGNSVTPSGPPVGGTSGPVPSGSATSSSMASSSEAAGTSSSSTAGSSASGLVTTTSGATSTAGAAGSATGSAKASASSSGTTVVQAGSGAGRIGVGVGAVWGFFVAVVVFLRG